MSWHKLLFLILLVPVLSSATITFERTYGGITGYEVACTSDYGYAVVGFYAIYRDIIYLVKTDSLGDTLWTRVVSQPYVNKGSYSLKELDDGGFIAVGYRDSINDPIPADAYLVRFNPFGDTLWSRLYGGDSLDKGYWIEITPDNGFIIAGSTSSGVYLIKTDSLGNIGIEEKEISDFAYQVPVLRIFPSLVTESFNIKYVITHTGATEVSLYDVTGARVKNLIKENLVPGYYQEKIDTRNLSSGVYFIVLKQDNDKISKKFLIVK